MNDPIERYYDDFERRYEEAVRPSRRPAPRFPVRRVAVAGALAGLALGIGVAVLPGTDDTDATAYAVQQAQKVLTSSSAIVHYQLVEGGTEPRADDVVNTADTDTWFVSESRFRIRLTFKPIAKAMKGQPSHVLDVAVADGLTSMWMTGQDHIEVSPNLEDAANQNINQDPIAQVRDLLADGRMVDAGPVTRGGRALRKLVTSPEAVRSLGRTELLVDAKTFVPVSVLFGGTVSTVERFERLPITPETRKLLEVAAPAGTPTIKQR